MKRGKRLAALAISLTLALSTFPAARGLSIYGYREGYAQASENGKWGFVNGNGSVVIPLQYDSVVSFSLGFAAVNLNGKLGVIRPDGTYLLQPIYDTLEPVGYGLYIAQSGANWGVVSILPYQGGDGTWTNEIYPLSYKRVALEKSGGVETLTLTDQAGSRSVVPLFRLPGILEELGVPGSQFPLTRGRLPAFSDVSERDWSALWVDLVYNVGIMAGTGSNRFQPLGEVTVAQALQMAANMDSRYKGDSFHTTAHQTTPWYSAAVEYCTASGIIRSGQFDDLERTVTRRELAGIFAATALAGSLPERNDRAQIQAAVGDVAVGDPGAEAIFDLYAKGILTGVDETLTFRPEGAVTRAEAAALAARLARPEQRVTWKAPERQSEQAALVEN